MKSNFPKIITFLTILAAPFVAVFLFFTYHIYRESSYDSERTFIVDRVDETGFTRLLVDRKISDGLEIARITMKILKRLGYNIYIGEYALPSRVSLLNAVKIIDSRDVVIRKITFPEGFSMFQVIQRLEKDENLLGTIKNVPQEGLIMPDTYYFTYPTTKQQIISQAQTAMEKFIQEEWGKRSPLCTLRSPNEALILASIVEKETCLEREMVAGVYLRRLKIKMKLQACPTAIYAHKRGDKLGHNLKYKELTTKDPYNTYVHYGLPPTPISNPGKASIMAVLHPLKTDNLFFVFDGVKNHIFSKTYEEHKRNIFKIRNSQKSKTH